MSELDDKTFLGRGWSFPPEIGKHSHGFDLVEAETDIHQSIRIILGTTPGERIMRPEFGCGIHKLVFEEMDESLKTLLKDRIKHALLMFESRISVNVITVEWSDYDSGVARILIDYTIRRTNTRKNMVYPFYLNEGTNIPMSSL